MLSKEICPERSVRYVGAITTQASSFIVGIPVHRKWRDESASPKLVACARVHESSTSLAERGGAVEERVTCVYIAAFRVERETASGARRRERERESRSESRALEWQAVREREERFEKKNVQLGRRTGRKRKRRERGTRMRSWRRIAGCRTTKQRPARRTVAPWRTPRFSCPEDGLLSVEGGTSCVRDERRSILTWRPRCFMNLIVPLRRGASPRWAHDYAAEESDA